jgi:L-ascorbate metabolism protein UlaG (beta-lactamase superfamily)
MRITFLGHACLLIQTGKMSVITDPYSPEIGYLPVDERANLVTLSHENPRYHSYTGDIPGAFETFHALEHIGQTVRKGGIGLESILVHEVLPVECPNAMVKISAENISVLHMGDCGHLPTNEQIAACGHVDVLLALAGGPPTIQLGDLKKFVEKLCPRIVIPMHYAVPNLSMSALGIEEFAALWDAEDVVRHQSSTLEITSGLLETELPHPQLHILEPKRVRP